MTEAEEQVAKALIEECRKYAYVSADVGLIQVHAGMPLEIDGTVNFADLARVAIKAIFKLGGPQ